MEHLKNFLRRGTVKIGTLYDYRQTELYGAVIGDESEGLHKTMLTVPSDVEIDIRGPTPEAECIRRYLFPSDQHIPPWKFRLDERTRLTFETHSPDLYVYCMTSRYDPEAMKQFNCDACIEIRDPEGFFKAISHTIRHKAQFDGFAPVQYSSKETHFTKPHRRHPAMMKDLEFEWQQEWRAVWKPHKTPRGPLIVDVPKAIRHCRTYVP